MFTKLGAHVVKGSGQVETKLGGTSQHPQEVPNRIVPCIVDALGLTAPRASQPAWHQSATASVAPKRSRVPQPVRHPQPRGPQPGGL